MKDENNDLRDRARGAERAHEKLEKELIESKMAWANIELERDNLTMKMKERQEQLNKYAQQVTKLELEMVRAKQALGEALNSANEVEMENCRLREELSSVDDKGKRDKKKKK